MELSQKFVHRRMQLNFSLKSNISTNGWQRYYYKLNIITKIGWPDGV
jgi:hypothetical protein